MIRSIPFARFAAELLALYESGRARSTLTKMRQVLKEFGAMEGVAATADLIPENVARYKSGPCAGRSPNTTAGLLSYLRRACSYAASRRYLEESPFAIWKGYVRTVDPGPGVHHSREAIARVLAHLATSGGFYGCRLHALCATLAYTGLRRNEALYLRREDVDADRKVIRVVNRRDHQLKRPSASRTVPICPELAPILAAWLEHPRPTASPLVFPTRGGRPWTGGSRGTRPADRLKEAGLRCGAKHFTPHTLRHSFATHAATVWGLPPLALQGIMGHSSLKVTMRYYVHADAANLAVIAERIRFNAA